MVEVAEDERLRRDLSRKGLRRAAEFSWIRTAELTLDAYREALGAPRGLPVQGRKSPEFVVEAIHKTVEYAELFHYPLTPEELRARLFAVEVDEATFDRVLKRLKLPANEDLLQIRALRERISDQAIGEAQPYLRTLISLPFVRMVAFSGSTAHRNMTDREDVDLFMIIEDGKLWAVLLIAMVWAKLLGVRKRLCMNYLISDAALALSAQDAFTAQQAASLKPFYGKTLYDRFIERNAFIRQWFPNFNPLSPREVYPEVQAKRSKRAFEAVLRYGPVQILEQGSRLVLGWYLRRKVLQAARDGDPDVLLTRRRLKLHLRSHKRELLGRMGDEHSELRDVVHTGSR